MSETLQGGCHCGAIRYEVDDIYDAGYCHCSICQHFSGAPAVAWANTPGRNFRITRGQPKGHQSSGHWERFFCPTCGSPVYQRHPAPPDDGSDLLCILIPTLDDPGVVHPTAHIWCSSKAPYFDTRDDLPRFEDGQLTHPDKRKSWRR